MSAGASFESMFLSSCTWLAPVYGGRAETISKRMAPTDQRSALASYFWKRRISGAM